MYTSELFHTGGSGPSPGNLQKPLKNRNFLINKESFFKS